MYSTGWSRDAFVEPHRIVLINAAGALEFLDKTYRPTKDRTIPPYLSEVLKENSRYVKWAPSFASYVLFANPTSTVSAAAAIERLLETDFRGIVHATCEGEASWFDFAQEIFRAAGINQKVVPCTTEEYPRPAPRPRNSRLEPISRVFSAVNIIGNIL